MQASALCQRLASLGSSAARQPQPQQPRHAAASLRTSAGPAPCRAHPARLAAPERRAVAAAAGRYEAPSSAAGSVVVEVLPDDAAVARYLCDAVEAAAAAAIQERGVFTLAIPGGSVLKALAGLKERQGIDWSKVRLFFVNHKTGKRWRWRCGLGLGPARRLNCPPPPALVQPFSACPALLLSCESCPPPPLLQCPTRMPPPAPTPRPALSSWTPWARHLAPWPRWAAPTTPRWAVVAAWRPAGGCQTLACTLVTCWRRRNGPPAGVLQLGC